MKHDPFEGLTLPDYPGHAALWRIDSVIVYLPSHHSLETAHTIKIYAKGLLAFYNHSRADFRRQEHFAELGGTPCPCFNFLEEWRNFGTEKDHEKDRESLPEQVNLIRRSLALCKQANRAWRRLRRGIKIRSQPAGDLDPVALAVSQRLDDLRVKHRLQSLPERALLTVERVNEFKLEVKEDNNNHVRIGRPAENAKAYAGDTGELWYDGPAATCPAVKVADRLAWLAVADNLATMGEEPTQEDEEQLLELTKDLIPRDDRGQLHAPLQIFHGHKCLILKLRVNGERPDPVACRLAIRRLAKVARYLNRHQEEINDGPEESL